MFSRRTNPPSALDLVESLSGNSLKVPELPSGYRSEPHPAKAFSSLGGMGDHKGSILLAQEKADPDREVPKDPPKKAAEPAEKAVDAPKKAEEVAAKAAPPAAPAAPVWGPAQCREIAEAVYTCFTGFNHHEDTAIKYIRTAHLTGNLERLKNAWDERYPKEWGLLNHTAYYLDVWDPRQSADGKGEGNNGWWGTANPNPVYQHSERAALMEVFHGSQAARDAANFYNRCHNATDNEDLIYFLENVSGYNSTTGTVTREGAARFRNMMAAYNQFGWQNQDHEAAYRRAMPDVARAEPTNTSFDATTWYEFNGTTLAPHAREILRLCRSAAP